MRSRLDLSKLSQEELDAYWKQRDEWAKAGLCKDCGSALKGTRRLCTNSECDRSRHMEGCPCLYGAGAEMCQCKEFALQNKYRKSGWIDKQGLHIGTNGFLSFGLAKEFFAGARNPEMGRPMANNTRLLKRGESYVVRLHDTDIITINPDNTFVLKTGGWFTPTTKERLNCYAPVQVYSDKGVWRIVKRGEMMYHSARSELFQEGMVVTAKGKVSRHSGSTARNLKKLSEQINHYVDGYCKHLLKYMKTHEHMPEPGGGDCWACLFSTEEDRRTHKFSDPMGYDHYFQHFSQRYFVPSLLWNALCERRSHPEFMWSMIEGQLRRGEDTTLRLELRYFLRKRIPHLLAVMDDNFRPDHHATVDAQLVAPTGQSLHYKRG